jgi:C-terminal processing protease CtpA/Prc
MKMFMDMCRTVGFASLIMLTVVPLLMGCQTQTAAPLPPNEYLDTALNWLEANAVAAVDVDWKTVHIEARALALQPQTTANTYAAIEYVLAQLDDPQAFMITPKRSVWDAGGLEITAVHPQNIIIEVKPGSPAAEADIRVGDRLLAIYAAIVHDR